MTSLTTGNLIRKFENIEIGQLKWRILEHVAAKDVYTDDYHRFYSNPEFDSDAMCIPNGGGVTDPQCCNNNAYTGAYVLFNAINKECCADGSTAAIGSC